jgi:heme oxygenase
MKILFLAAVMAAISLQEANGFGIVPSTTTTTTKTTTKTTTTGVSFALQATSMETTATTAKTAEEEIANPRLSGLAFALDDGTRKSHSMAENTAFVQGFFKGISSPDSYKNLLTSLYYVYYAMEVDVMDTIAAELEMEITDYESESPLKSSSEDAKWIKALDEAPLRRLAGLEQDMEYFYGSNWKSQITPPTKGTQVYVGRIRELAATLKNDDEKNDEIAKANAKESLLYLFVAHQYTRYLGDLFGGQMMGSMASRSMDLPADGSGVAFYTFEGVPSTKDFITKWYTTLNALGVSDAQQQSIVDEANLVFQLNIGILEELEGSPWAALWTLAVRSAKEFTDWTNIKESKNDPQQQQQQQ